jgi:2-C-methyl-D-erythritol 4-phosphate cytidylyltransferase
MSARAALVVPAGGSGRRMGGAHKPFLALAGEPLLLHALRPFLAIAAIEWVVIALAAEDAASPPPWLTGLDERIRLVAGGSERGESVRNALLEVPAAADVILIHDAARPLVTRSVIEHALASAARGLNAVVAVPVTDTIKQVDEGGRIVATLDRRTLWAAQTPQAFPRATIADAYARAAREGITATDDAALVARYGGTVVVIEGEPENIKITTPADLDVAEALLHHH